MSLSQALCQKVTKIVTKYIKENPDEWEAFKFQQRKVRDGLRTKWAEVNGHEGVLVREILQIPELFFNMLRMELSDDEYLEWTEDRYKVWFGNKFPDFRTTEDKL